MSPEWSLPKRPVLGRVFLAALLGWAAPPAPTRAPAAPARDHRAAAAPVPAARTNSAAFALPPRPNPGNQNAGRLPGNGAAGWNGSRNGQGLVALTELGVLLAPGAVWYYLTPANVLDQDFTVTEKFTTLEPLRFDDNLFSLNLGHALSGMIYYQTGRYNGLGRWPSFLLTTGASTFWEYLVENREVTSVNDAILTPLAGFAAGEAVYQVVQSLQSRPSLGSGVAAALLRPTGGIAPYLFQQRRALSAPDEPADGRTATYDVHLGGYLADGPAGLTGALAGGAAAHVVMLPGYAAAGTASDWVLDTAFADARLDLGTDLEHMDADCFTRIAVLAYRHKDLIPCGTRGLRGHELIWALTEDFQFESERLGYENTLARVSLLGTSLDVTLFADPARIRMLLNASADFCMVDALAYEPNRDVLERSRTPTVIFEKGYFYGGGVRTEASATVAVAAVEAGCAFVGRYCSHIKGLDRRREELDDEYDVSDEKTVYTFWGRLRLTPEFGVKAAYERIEREGRLDVFAVAQTADRYSLAGTWTF